MLGVSLKAGVPVHKMQFQEKIFVKFQDIFSPTKGLKSFVLRVYNR